MARVSCSSHTEAEQTEDAQEDGVCVCLSNVQQRGTGQPSLTRVIITL